MIELTPAEMALWHRIKSHDEEADWEPTRSTMQELTTSLLQSNKIPPQRLRYMEDPALNPGAQGKSRIDVFVANGCALEDISGHPHFEQILRYWIDGPDLPTDIQAEFRAVVDDCQPVTSGDQKTLRETARRLARKLDRIDYKTVEAFLQLAVDCGLDDDDALAVRAAVKTVR